MKHFLLKAALTLGLICMYCANISALPAWSDEFNASQITAGSSNKLMKELPNYWFVLKNNGYYLYYNDDDPENGHWDVTATLPTSNITADWKNYLFTADSYSSGTCQVKCANGLYLSIATDGTISATKEASQLYFPNGGGTTSRIRNTKSPYYYIIVQDGHLATTDYDTSTSWNNIQYDFSFVIGNYRYTIITFPTESNAGTVAVSLNNYNVTNAVIESSVEYCGETYNVTTVDQFAQSGNANFFPGTFPYTQGSKCGTHAYSIDGHDANRYNPTLKTVTFKEPCNVTTIASRAFDGCGELTTFTVPYSVTTIGSYAFYLCRNMTSFHFQTNQEGKTQITTINERTFKFCENLKSLELPEGITTIGNEALQFNISMTTIKLPNSLTTIGTHFMCSAISLSTLTIPANVTSIDGSAFHGCQNLKTVYLLGPASALDPGTSGNTTFGENNSYCAAGVHGCTFYTTMDYIASYKAEYTADGKNNTWWKIDSINNTLGNKLKAPIPNTRKLQKGQWATICFAKLPANEAEFNAIFGTKGVDSEDGWRVAIMTDAEVDSYEHEGGDPNLYHTYYTTIPFSEIKTNTPYLICPGKTVDYVGWEAADEADQTFKENMTINHNVAQQASDGAWVYMVGRILGIDELYPDDIYFKAVDEVGTDKVVGGFYQVKNGIKVKLGACRAYWHIYQNGVKSETAALGGVKKVNNTENVDAINEIERDVRVVVNGIYDMNGRKLNVTQEQLPKGMYIMDGKKMLVK